MSLRKLRLIMKHGYFLVKDIKLSNRAACNSFESLYKFVFSILQEKQKKKKKKAMCRPTEKLYSKSQQNGRVQS